MTKSEECVKSTIQQIIILHVNLCHFARILTFLSLETEYVSCKNKNPLDSNLFRKFPWALIISMTTDTF